MSTKKGPRLVLGKMYRFRPHSPLKSGTVMCCLAVDVSKPDRPICLNTEFLPEQIECGVYIGKFFPNKCMPVFLIGEKTYAIDIKDVVGTMK